MVEFIHSHLPKHSFLNFSRVILLVLRKSGDVILEYIFESLQVDKSGQIESKEERVRLNKILRGVLLGSELVMQVGYEMGLDLGIMRVGLVHQEFDT